jgi:hypothetical protein
LALVLVAWPTQVAHAQSAPGYAVSGVPPAPEPMAFALRLEVSRSASRPGEFVAASERGALRLRVSPDNLAELSFEAVCRIVYGTAGREVQYGDREATSGTALERTRFLGRATRLGSGALALRFHRIEQSVWGWQSTGAPSAPMPPPSRQRASFALDCAIATRSVLPATPAAGETATAVPVLVCRFEGPRPASFLNFELDELVFGAGAGLAASAHLHHQELELTRELREAREP